MNNSKLYIENIALGLKNVSNLEKLDMNLNEYVIVGERINNDINNETIENQYNFIINNKGIGINASRRELRDTNAGLFINNSIICKGGVVAESFKIKDFVFDSSLTAVKLDQLIKKVNSNLLFFDGYYNSNININNIYTPNYLTIGSISSTFSNSHPFKIIDNPTGRADNIQFGIYNNINNDIEAAHFSIGMMGFNQYSPLLLTTTTDMPLEFHISKSSIQLNKLYENGTGLPLYYDSNYPNLTIDINGCVNINKDKCDNTIFHNNNYKNPIFYVNGYSIISNLAVYDYYSSQNLHLDDIYIRRQGLTLKANQIIGGDFIDQEFIFNSNIYIGRSNSNLLLTVNGEANISKTLRTNNLIANNTMINGITNFNKNTYFNNTTVFNDNITIDKSLNINNDLFINGYRVYNCNLDFASNGINYDFGSNLNISGRFGTGILNTDTYDHQFNIIKRNKERFEVYIQDFAGITIDSSKVYMGHTYLNDINGGIDNSFIIFTQKNIRWHNIYFYAGKDKDGTKGIKNLIPNFAIMENNRIGVNTNLPQKSLDVVGEIITNDYFIKRNNINLKLNFIYFNSNNNSILNVNTLDINLNSGINYNNKKTLNITGGINSYNGYFENSHKLASFKIYDNIATTFNNIGIGIIDTNNFYSIPLQIRNMNTSDNNNSIIRIYRGIKGGGFNNNSLYSGIDFCDYDMPIITQNRNNYKWFIYKNNNHNKETTGALQIGYTDNSYNPTHSCMNFYYNKNLKKYFIDINNPNINYNYDNDNIINIKGNVAIEGNINLKGDNCFYKINNAIIGSLLNPATLKEITDITNTYTTDNLNDVSFLANKIILIPKKTTVIGFNDDWLFTKINTLDNYTNNTPLFIYNNKDYTDNNEPPVVCRFYNKSYKNYISRPDISVIELGILSDSSDDGIINNKIDLTVKGYENKITIFEIKPNNIEPFFTCISENSKNQINVGNGIFYSSNIINFKDTCFHISDDFDCLLRLTNNTKASKLTLINNLNKWDISASNSLNFIYNNKSIFNLSSSGIITINSRDDNNNSSFNINGYVNKSSIELTNSYYNDYIENQNNFITDTWINVNFNIISIDYENIHEDNYDDNFDSNLSKFIYKINDSNLPSQDYLLNNINNYYINNSNISFDNSTIINLNTTLNNIELDYKFLDNINVYTSSNTIELIPTLKTDNNNLNVSFKTFNIISIPYNLNGLELLLNYKVPLTIDINQLYIESTISNFSLISTEGNNNYYILNLNTFLKIKDKPLFDYNIKIVNATFILIDINGINHNYQTTNIIYYYPIPNINISDLDININYIYNYQNSFVIPKNFYNNNYINTNDIITNNTNIIVNNSNSFLNDFIDGNSIINQIDAINFKSFKLISSSTINKIYSLEINDVIISDLIINITKNNYYEVYDFALINPIIQLPITTNLFQPHMIMKNYINSSYSQSHKFYSYNNNYEIFLDNTKLLSLNQNGNLDISGNIKVNDIYFSGDIYSDINGTITSITENLTHIIGNNFYIHKENISMNSINIYLNPSYLNGGGVVINGSDINQTNNLFQINNYIGTDDFITLKSVTSSSYIIFNNTTSIYKLGVNDGNFCIYKNDTNVINFNYIDDILNIDINGHIKTSQNFSINNITTYINNDNNYRLRVFGNLKVDGVVMSSSDKRIKNNITSIDNALDKIEKLSGVFYYYNSNSNFNNHRQMGLIAQEVKEVIPEVVYEDEKGYLNIAYGNLMGVVIEAIKELRNEIKNNK